MNAYIEKIKKIKSDPSSVISEIGRQELNGKERTEVEDWFEAIFYIIDMAEKEYEASDYENVINECKSNAKTFGNATINNIGDDTFYYKILEKIHLSSTKKKIPILIAEDYVDMLENSLGPKCYQKVLKFCVDTIRFQDFKKNYIEYSKVILQSNLVEEEVRIKIGKYYFGLLQKAEIDFPISKYSLHKDHREIIKFRRECGYKNLKNSDKIINGILMSIFSILLAITGIFSYRYLNGIKENSIQITLDYENGVINRVYGEDIDLSGITISYLDNLNREKKVTVTNELIFGYDPEIIGYQTIEIKFGDETKEIEIFTEPQQLKSTTLSFKENNLIWERVENAQSYQVLVGPSLNALESLGTTKDAYFTLDNMPYGYLYFQVKALDETSDKYVASLSNTIKVLNLPQIKNIKYENEKISWEKINDASYYFVYINGEKKKALSNELNFVFDKGTYKVEVEAYSDYDLLILKEPKCVEFTVLSTVKNVKVVSDKILWDCVEKAKSYDIYINDVYYLNVETNELNVSNLQTNIYKIGIVAKSDKNNDINSKEFVVNCLINFNAFIEDDILYLPEIQHEYNIFVNEEKQIEKYNSSKLDLNKIELKEGINKIRIEIASIENVIYDLSQTIDVIKLKSPILSVNNEVLNVNDETKVVKYYINGEEFDGDLNKITAPGTYKITAKYIGTENELDSEYSNELIITKLEAPIISVLDKKVCVDDESKNVKYYINGEEFDGNLSKIEDSGTYKITAKYIGAENELDSEYSNELIITKLEAPTISVLDKKVCVDDETKAVKYYIDGEEFDGDLNKIAAPGTYKITAKYLGDGVNTLSSPESPALDVFVSKTTIEIEKSTNNRVELIILSEVEELKYDMTIYFYNGEEKIDSIESFNNTGIYKMVSYKRNDIISTKITIIIKVKSDKGIEDVIVCHYQV